MDGSRVCDDVRNTALKVSLFASALNHPGQTMAAERKSRQRYPGPRRPYPRTHPEVLAKYHALDLIDEPGDSPAGKPPPFTVSGPTPCKDCGRDIVWASRWNGKPVPLNAKPRPNEPQTWLETAMGHFEPAFHHDCPGSETDADAKARRKRQREEQGIPEPGEKPPKWRSKKGQFDMF